jgi:hypothetical protein
VSADAEKSLRAVESRRGVASKAQKQIRAELLRAGAAWWMARSARTALTALHLSNVPFRRRWKPPRLKPWEGPFADPAQRLPQHPQVAAELRHGGDIGSGKGAPERSSRSRLLLILQIRSSPHACRALSFS